MAHNRPWYKRGGGSFLMATIGFPDAEHKWAYSALIDMLNDRDRPIPDDPGFICGFTGLTRKKWSIVRSYLITHGYIVVTFDDCLTNPRFERERAERAGEHKRAVESGRAGGKKAAENRARQGDLALDETGQKSAESRDESTPESTPESRGDAPAKVQRAARNSNGLAEGPPLPSRARDRASESRDKKEEEESTTTPSESPARGGDAALDLHKIASDLARMGGVPLINPGQIASAVDLVRKWIVTEGIDLDTVIVPTIQRQFENTSEDRIASLAFYAQAIATASARAHRNAKSTRRNSDSVPVMSRDDETEAIALVRQTLFERMGREAYCTYVNPVRFEAVQGAAGGKRPLRVHDHRFAGRLDDHRHAHILREAALSHGFTDIW